MGDLSNNTNWSEVDNSNNSASPNGWPSDGSMLPNQVEPSARNIMGALKRFWNRINSTVTTTGSAGAYVYTPSNTAYPSAYNNGETFSFVPNFTSVGSDTLNINSLGAKPIYKPAPKGYIVLGPGDITSGVPVIVEYNSTIGGFVLLSRQGNCPSQQYISGVASASTVDLGAQAGDYIQITGTTTITSFGSSPVSAGAEYTLIFNGVLTLTYNATSMILPTAANVVTAAGDVARFRYEGAGNWRCVSYARASGYSVAIQSNVNVQAFSSSGTWTAPVGINQVLVIAIGAGGGGGGGNNGGGTGTSGGSGGSGGNRVACSFKASDCGASQTITIGASGAAGTATTGGGDGGNTTFGSLLTAFGGRGGGLGYIGGGGSSPSGPGGAGPGGRGGPAGTNATVGSAGVGGGGPGGAYNSTTIAGTSGEGGGGGGGGSGAGPGGASAFGGGGGGGGAFNGANVSGGAGGASTYGSAGTGGSNTSGTVGGSPSILYFGGGGGGGGGPGTGGNGTAGGNGGTPGGGGGGGGGSSTGTGGAGGAGGPGYCIVFSW
jgi:hypothetical protein